MDESPWESGHYKDGRFFNPGGARTHFRQVMKWLIGRKAGPWRMSYRLVAHPPPPSRVEGSGLRVTFVNHSTVLIQTQGQNILTDPIWSERASPVSFIGPKRFRQPGIAFDDLPRIDSVLISHNHYDHLDVLTLKRILLRNRPTIFCPLGVTPLLREIGFPEIFELDWWQVHERPEMRIHCVPAQHFSSRTPFDRDRTLWCGFVLETAGGNIYFAGDTGFGGHFEPIARRLAPIRFALLPIGAFKPEWFMGPIHMTPEQAVEAHGILEAKAAMAIHFGTFALADDGQDEAVDRLRNCLAGIRQPDLIWVLAEGEGRDVPE